MVWPRLDHRAFVSSNPALYDFESANQFNLLTLLGLREDHYVLDVGCGSLRAGRLLIPYLQPGHYYGLEPEERLVSLALSKELGHDLVKLRRPVFVHNAAFNLGPIKEPFDFILAHSIFSHASRGQILSCLALVGEVLAEGGVFLASYYPGERSYAGENWVYPGFVSYKPSDLSDMVAGSGLNMANLAWPQPSNQQWIRVARSEQALARFEMEERVALAAERATREAVSKLYKEMRKDPLYRLAIRARALLTQLGFKAPNAGA